MVIRVSRDVLIRQLITAGIILTLLFTLSCCIEPPPDEEPAAEPPEIVLDVAWRIPMESPGQGYNSLFVDNKMYFPNIPGYSVDTINLDTHSVENRAQELDIGTNPVIINDTVYIAKWSFIDKISAIFMFNRDGELIGSIQLDETNYGIDFRIFAHSRYIYWKARYNDSSSFVQLDTDTITNTSGDSYTADVKVLCPTENNYSCGANPSFYDGKVYLPVNHIDAYENGPYNSRVLVFDEDTGNMEQNIELESWIPCSVMGDVLIKSGNNAAIYRNIIDLTTGKILKQIRAAASFAPLTEYDNCLYGTSSEYGSEVGDLSTTVWKLNMNTLEVEWYYQHEYSCGTQPQVVNDIVYVTAPDMILLFDAETGKILAKDTDLKGHPIQQANSYLYNGEMIFHDGYYITAIKTNWKKNHSGGVEKVE